MHGAAEERARRHAERAAERVPARDLDAGEDDLRELRPHLPAALAPDRAQDRLHVAGVVADDLPRHQLAVRDDRARVLADRLAVADDAVVGVDGEEDEVRAVPARRRPSGTPARAGSRAASPRRGRSSSELLAGRRSRRSSRRARARRRCRARAARFARAAASTSSASAAATTTTPSASAQTRSPGWTVTPPSVTGTRERAGPVLRGPARRGADGGRPARRRASSCGAVADRAVDDDPGDAALARGEGEDVAAVARVRVSPPTASTITSPGSAAATAWCSARLSPRRALHGERRAERVRRRPRGLEAEQRRRRGRRRPRRAARYRRSSLAVRPAGRVSARRRPRRATATWPVDESAKLAQFCGRHVTISAIGSIA